MYVRLPKHGVPQRVQMFSVTFIRDVQQSIVCDSNLH